MEQVLTEKQSKESSELCEMLPWHVNRTLNEAETCAIEVHLRHCEACVKELPILRAIRESMRNESVAVLPPKPNAEQFLADASRHKKRSELRTLTWIAVAASVAIFAVVLIWTQTGTSNLTPGEFETATSAGGDTTFDYVWQISFDPKVDPQQHSAALKALAPESVAGPDSEGNYRVVIRLPARSMRELQDFTRNIEANSAISNATIVAMELPVEPR